MHQHAAFGGKVIFYPHVVVTCKKMNRYARVGNGGNNTEKPCETSWNDLAVFPPEVKDVAYQVDLPCFRGNSAEPSYYQLLPLDRVFPGLKSEMKV